MTSYSIRPAQEQYYPAIYRLLESAFPSEAEAHLVQALRANPRVWDPGISLIALGEDQQIVGYILISRCWVGPWPSYALAPLSVHPDWQGRGVGTALVQAAISQAQQEAQAGNAPTSLIVLGEPGYYSRFGFTPAAQAGIRAYIQGLEPAQLAQHLQVLNLTPDYQPTAGEVIWPSEYGLDQGDDL